VTGGANISGALSFNSIEVTENALIHGTAAIEDGLAVTGGIAADFAVLSTTLTVSGVATINNRLDVTGGLNFSQGITGDTGVLSSTLFVDAIVCTAEVSAQSFVTTSDRRFKKDFEEVAGALAKVRALHPVLYNWISSANINPAVKELGFIAQEVEEVIPNVISTGNDAAQTKRVAYDRLTSLLVAAVQEQSAALDALAARVSSLESRA
jgi:hypothetical protein